MRKITFIGIISFVFILSSVEIFENNLEQVLSFASIEKAKELLKTEDEFTNNWSKFDVISRLMDENGTEEQLFEFISNQVLSWTDTEKEKLNSIITKISKKIEKNGFKLNFPETVFLVKTTTKEEAGALGYTRANYIVLQSDILTRSEKAIEKTITHELFHILTRNDSNFRNKVYEIIGFRLCNDIEYPGSIANLRITNPDAPENNCYIQLNNGNKNIDCSMIIYSKKEYSGGSFFGYINVSFLVLDGDESNKRVKIINGKPLILSFKEVDNFFEQVGRNTRYIIHPEEILADNFVFAMNNEKNLPDQKIVKKLRNILKSF